MNIKKKKKTQAMIYEESDSEAIELLYWVGPWEKHYLPTQADLIMFNAFYCFLFSIIHCTLLSTIS